jgi:hypothetical protein
METAAARETGLDVENELRHRAKIIGKACGQT